jgi:tRNA-2-methylthio-N6-dimethylallyladenosine synthase
VKVYIETFGCQMNKLDSELVESLLRRAGHELVDNPSSAEVLLYNTCSVRRHAEQKVHSRLGTQEQRKRAGRKLVVGVLGCMAQREGGELFREHPHVDVVCGPGQIWRLPELLAAAAGGEHALALDPAPGQAPDEHADARMDQMDLSRDAAGPAAAAFVRVSRGCDKFCTYCIVPAVRGRERSRHPDHVVAETRRLVDAGRSEITLLGQTVNSYLWRSGETSIGFADLLARVSSVAGVRRLRFVTSHPVDFGDDVLKAMRDLPNVCPYLHVPAQSGSDAVLRRMARRYTRAQYDELVDRARAIVPGVVLAGDFIVGFPGETEDDHLASADLIRYSGYKNSFVFKYSPRPGTAAARMKDDVPTDVKKRRNNELLAVQEQVGLAHHQAYVGQTVEVLVEGPSPRASRQAAPPGQTQMLGRTRGDHIVVFDASPAAAGSYMDVRIKGASALTLFGELPV